jgi:hypothetical protein
MVLSYHAFLTRPVDGVIPICPPQRKGLIRDIVGIKDYSVLDLDFRILQSAVESLDYGMGGQRNFIMAVCGDLHKPSPGPQPPAPSWA